MSELPIYAQQFRARVAAELEKSGCCVLSEGTYRPQDLIPKYTLFLDDYDPARRASLLVPEEALEDGGHPWWGTETCDEVRAELEDALNELAPEGYRFGASEGDGASLGFWKED